MATGRETKLTQQVGEHLVCAELGRRGFIATTFTGNVPVFDIVALDENHKIKLIQVKAIDGGEWQIKDVSKYLDISISDNGIQNVKGIKDIQFPDLICIFVKLVFQGNDEFYLFRLSNMQDIIFEKYGSWLRKKGGIRPRNQKSMHAAVSSRDLEKYKNNWELLKE